ncbi:MAG: preprotein translocase subunit SecY [Candidatus Aenigmarchaeota archaeon]|nr:preprotein translocase subunit SecY [Candidatus Aenigmarchaeota archaeon]
MVDWVSIAGFLPSVTKPERRLTLNQKLKWTILILLAFFLLGSITCWGVDSSAVARFEFLEIVFGSKFGSLITLGIGPIVTSSIILQLLVGSKIINWDTKTELGKTKFTTAQKLLTFAFCIFEAIAYVLAGAVPAAGGAAFLKTVVIFQLILGGLLIVFMDEVCSKWGIGSGVSLFIAAGVSKTIFIRLFAPPIGEAGGGAIASIIFLLTQGQPVSAFISLFPIISTLFVFGIVVYAQAMRVEIPMAFSMPFGKFAARRWPLKFIYASVIPVILVSAVVANLQVVGRIMENKGFPLLGTFDASSGQASSGLVFYMTSPNSVGLMIVVVLGGLIAIGLGLLASRLFKKYVMRISFLGALIGVVLGYLLVNSIDAVPVIASVDYLRTLTYMITMMIGATIFSIFWVATSGMDSKSVAEQFKGSFLSLPGFRRDPRIIEKVLERYIPALSILGGLFIGLLASFADLTNAFGTGTGILLAAMIIFQLYEQISKDHFEELHPSIRKFMG